jgi:Phycobilisome degradation protein nblA
MNPSSFELSMEQQFQVRLVEHTMQDMNREQMQDMLMQLTRLLLVKDNVIRDLVKSCALGSTM